MFQGVVGVFYVLNGRACSWLCGCDGKLPWVDEGRSLSGCGCDCMVGLSQYAGEVAKLGMPFYAEDCAFLLR